MQKRQPARKVWIADVLNAKPKINEQGFKTFELKDKETIRVNITAGVIASYTNEEGSYATITLDDSSAQIRIKAWNDDVAKTAHIEIGDVVLVIGRINSSDPGNEIFIRPEIIKKLNIPWMQLRRAELQKEFGLIQPVVTEEVVTDQQHTPETPEETVAPLEGVPLAVREKVIQSIEANDIGQGSDMMTVIRNSGVPEPEAEAAINELIMEGEAFQPKPGFIKLIS